MEDLLEDCPVKVMTKLIPRAESIPSRVNSKCEGTRQKRLDYMETKIKPAQVG